MRRVTERGAGVEPSGAPDVFSALANPVRRQLLMELRAGPKTASTLSGGMPIARSAISEHLALLRDVGLVRVQSAAASASIISTRARSPRWALG